MTLWNGRPHNPGRVSALPPKSVPAVAPAQPVAGEVVEQQPYFICQLAVSLCNAPGRGETGEVGEAGEDGTRRDVKEILRTGVTEKSMEAKRLELLKSSSEQAGNSC